MVRTDRTMLLAQAEATLKGSWMLFVRSAGIIFGLVFAACSTKPVKAPTPCASSSDCETGQECRSGACIKVSTNCTAGELSCDGTHVVKCKADGTGYDEQTICATGCADGACV